MTPAAWRLTLYGAGHVPAPGALWRPWRCPICQRHLVHTRTGFYLCGDCARIWSTVDGRGFPCGEIVPRRRWPARAS
jgi:hypothetical protein